MQMCLSLNITFINFSTVSTQGDTVPQGEHPMLIEDTPALNQPTTKVMVTIATETLSIPKGKNQLIAQDIEKIELWTTLEILSQVLM